MRHLAILMILLASSASALDSLVADREVLLDRHGGGSLGAWPAGWGGAAAERLADGVRFTLAGPAQMALVNFNAHQPLAVAALPREPAPVVRLELRLEADGPRHLRLGWRGDEAVAVPDGDGAAVEPGAWTALVLPMPAAPPGGMARGWVLALDGPGRIELREAVLGWRTQVLLDPLPRDVLHRAPSATLRGRAVGAAEIVLRVRSEAGALALERRATVRDGAFSVEVAAAELPAYAVCTAVAALPGPETAERSSAGRTFYAYPASLGRSLPPVSRQGSRLFADGRPFAFVGINHTDLMMPHARDYRPEDLAREVGRMSGWGMRAMRVALAWGMIQPAEGVFPGDPRWQEELRARGLNQRWLEELDYLVALAGAAGIYTIIDLHEPPCDPHRWFLGGDHRKPDEPGTAIAWLAPDRMQRVEFDVAIPRHRQGLLSTWRWLATHFRGNGNVLGFESPFNEPHDRNLSNQERWSELTSAVALAVKAVDPERLVFAMPAGWGHDNVAWSHTWLQPVGIDGLAPHHYLANGPVPLRSDAGTFKEPWNAREQEATFERSLASVFLASATGRQPVYNGEGGDWLPRVFLPQVDEPLARQMMYEATLAQCYAAGTAGHLNWRVTHDDGGYDLRVYAAARRFAPVYAAGPVDWSQAEVAVVQNSEAVPSVNGHNFACVPFAELMLALHLGPVHYLSDDEVVYRGIVRESKGLEQVSDASAALAGYKAILVDPRNLDARVAAALKSCPIPQLVVSDPGHLDAPAVAAFLTAQGVAVDTRTPAGIQVAVGPQHLVLFRRAGDSGPFRLHIPLAISGSFRLEDESGRSVFSGGAAELVRDGAALELDRWRAAILRIRR